MPQRRLPDTDQSSQGHLATGDVDGVNKGLSVAHDAENTENSGDDNRKNESADLLDAAYVARMELGKKIKAAREALRMSQSELARRVGMKQQSIGSIEEGKVLRPGKLPEIARALQKPLSHFLGEQETNPKQSISSLVSVQIEVVALSVAGDTAAGVWMEQDAWDVEKYDPVAYVPVRYKSLAHQAWHVSGSSMDQLGIVDGSFVVTVEYGAVRSSPISGDVVVVERRRGAMVERTCKEVSVTSSGVELIPRSSDKKQKSIFMPHGHSEPDGTEIEIIGLVVGSVRNFN